MSDYVTSVIRTLVPAAWGALVALLVARGLPPELAQQAGEFAVPLTGLAIACWYAVARWLEPRVPNWVAGLLLGSARPPAYGGPSA